MISHVRSTPNWNYAMMWHACNATRLKCNRTHSTLHAVQAQCDHMWMIEKITCMAYVPTHHVPCMHARHCRWWTLCWADAFPGARGDMALVVAILHRDYPHITNTRRWHTRFHQTRNVGDAHRTGRPPDWVSTDRCFYLKCTITYYGECVRSSPQSMSWHDVIVGTKHVSLKMCCWR